MTLKQIETRIFEVRTELSEIRKKLSKLSTELSDLRINRHTSLMDSFSKYFNINHEIEFSKVFWNANQVYTKKTGINHRLPIERKAEA